MKTPLLICSLFAGLLTAASADPAKDLSNAAKKLTSAKNYTWSSSTAFGDREARTITGKTGSGGHTMLSMPMRNNTIDILIRNGKAAFKEEDGWQLASAEAEGDENRRLRFLAGMASNYEPPTKRVTELIEGIGELKAEEGTYRGELREEAAKKLMTFRGRGRGDRQAPPIAGASGSVTFTVQDGVLTKYELKLSGKMSFNEEERDISRTTTVTFSELGSTNFDISEEAAGLLAE